jgi:hypothetical protein
MTMWRLLVAIPRYAVGVLMVAGLLVVATGCEQEDAPVVIPAAPVNFGKMGCACEDRRDGECPCASAECSACASACSCTHCPAFAPEPRQPFDACGGQAVGTWVTTAFPQADFELTRFYFEKVTAVCRTELLEGPATFEFRVTLENDSTARFQIGAAAIKFTGLRECLGDELDCDTIGTVFRDFENCWDTGCGICQCESSVHATNTEGTWQSSGSLLQFGVSDAPAPFDWNAPFEYCQRGDTLELRHTHSDLRYTLTRLAAP